MRQCEKIMLQAIERKQNAKIGNTIVLNKKNGVFVFLHGNLIFAQVNGVKFYSNCGWNTRTTASRLRALGADYSTNISKRNCDLLSPSEIYDIFWSCK